MNTRKYNKNLRARKSIRLRNYDYSQPGAYFVTICAQGGEYSFGNITNTNVELSTIGKIAYEVWIEIPYSFNRFELDEFIIMPNHIHGILLIKERTVENTKCSGLMNQTPTGDQNHATGDDWILMRNAEQPLGKIVRFYKAKTTKLFHDSELRHFKWQRNYYERVLRNEEDLNRAREYIINNPLKWNLDRENPFRTGSDNDGWLYHKSWSLMNPESGV